LIPEFLSTLSEKDIRSGICEILKACAVDGWDKFNLAGNVVDKMLMRGEVLQEMIFCALQIKKEFVERDEFDRNERVLFNYGHTFGHAIEAATNFEIPHGIAVGLGMDMAAYISMRKNLICNERYRDINQILKAVVRSADVCPIDRAMFRKAISRDKKVVDDEKINLILPVAAGTVEKKTVSKDEAFFQLVGDYFDERIGDFGEP